jgi:hypothetical protein
MFELRQSFCKVKAETRIKYIRILLTMDLK